MKLNNQPTISIIGGGAAALMLAARIDTQKYRVTLYEKNKVAGRKFLVAGKGGFNLTHNSDIREMIQLYYPSDFLAQSLNHFSNKNLIKFLDNLGIKTFVGSSNRVFPERGIKPIEVLNAFLNKIKARQVVLKMEHRWKGFHQNGGLLFKNEEKLTTVTSDYVIFALGGASWSKTGSAGDWLAYFEEQNIPILPFQASNCAFQVDWHADLLKKIEGQPLKNMALICENKKKKGELMITKFGLEGSPIYAHSRCLRDQLNERGKAAVFIDLKPNLTEQKITEKIEQYHTKKSWTIRLQKSLNLSPVQLALLRHFTTKDTFTNLKMITKAIKKLPLEIVGIAPIEEAISTVGGIKKAAVDTHFQLKSLPNHFVIGEMLDWDAPTGGYLLQGCFSMGVWVADYLNNLE